VEFVLRHLKDFVGELAEPFGQSVNGDEVGTLTAAHQFFISSAFGASSARMAFATRAMNF